MRQGCVRSGDEKGAAVEPLGAAQGRERRPHRLGEQLAHLLFAHPAADAETPQRRIEQITKPVGSHSGLPDGS